MKVRDLMTPDPVSCTASCSVREAASLMKECEVGLLPVLDDLRPHLVIGVVTDRDLCVSALAGGRDQDVCSVADCMSVDPVICSPDDKDSTALRLMREHQVRRLPVVHGREVVGIISMADLVRSVTTNTSEAMATLRAIHEPGGRHIRPQPQRARAAAA